MSLFDRFAEWTDRIISRAAWFVVCLVLVLGWLAFGPIAGWANNTWHLALNSPTTSLTFLMVALEANARRRDSLANQQKLNAIADALAQFMDAYASHGETPDIELHEAVGELCDAVGLEERQSTD